MDEENYEFEDYESEEEPEFIESVAQEDFDAFKADTDMKFAEIQARVDAANVPLGAVSGYISIAAIAISLLTIIVCVALCNKNSSRVDKMRDNHSQQIRVFDKKISELKNKISNLEQQLIKIKIAQDKIIAEKNTPPQKKVVEVVQPKKIPFEDFVNEFNALLNLSGQDADSRRVINDFIQKFNVRAFNCTNAEQRIDEPVPPPKFAEVTPAKNGNYWAFEFESGLFAVVPKIKNYNNNIHYQQAMGEIFQSNFNDGGSFNKIFVSSPAIFNSEWTLKSKGALILA